MDAAPEPFLLLEPEPAPRLEAVPALSPRVDPVPSSKPYALKRPPAAAAIVMVAVADDPLAPELSIAVAFTA